MKLPGIMVLVSALGSLATAQTTRLVGSPGFPQISNAIAASAPGDIVLVPPGTWSSFTTTLGVTVRGTGPGVTVLGATANLPANQTLHLIGLDVFAFGSLAITGGRADIDRCQFRGTVVASDVRLQSCTVTGFTFTSFLALDGLDCTNANVTAIDTSFTGGPGVPQSAVPSTYGLRLQGCTFVGSGLVVRGGDGYGGGSSDPKAALFATNSTVWISDSTLSGGGFPGGAPSACPVATQGSTGRLSRCTSVPACASPIPTNGPLLGVHRPSPLQSPGVFALDFRTQPNALVAVFFATGLGNAAIPGFEQPVLLDVATALPLALLPADATGSAAGTWNVPAGLANATIWFQAVDTAAPGFPLQLSPVAGGVVN